MRNTVHLLLVFMVGALVGAGACTAGDLSDGFGVFGGDRVAVVHVEGAIGVAGSSLLGGGGVSADTVTDWLRRAERDRSVKAVVLRVNSPGGGVTPSDEIRNQVLKLRDKKPVVVSMGSLAASGGYYISAPANVIMANETSLTGSIGVITTIPNVQGLMEKVGVSVDVLKSGEEKGATSMLRPLAESSRAIMQGVVDDAYDRFVQVVAQGRSLPADKVRALADGRIYTARQAKDLGLIDAYGDLPEAIVKAAELGGIPGTPRVTRYQQRGSLLQQLSGGLTESFDLSALSGQMTGQTSVSVQYLFVP
ncbi:MAG: signal peptide peptidase SppA [Dehalococcoidia bacterium]|nr:signal peptide peptidase SppA [Dehalococcoidia bacterium]